MVNSSAGSFLRPSFLFILICLIPFAAAPAQWYLLNPKPTCQYITGVVFLDQNRGMAVGHNGTLLKTNNGGTTWYLVDKAISANLNSIAAGKDQSLHICGSQGILITTNFDLDPFIVTSIGTQNLNVIRFSGTQTGYCAGSGGLFLKSTDGGDTWNKIIIDSTLTFNDLAFPSGYIGYLSSQKGNAGVLMKTYDGGAHWVIAFEHYNFFGRMSFVDEENGYLTGPWTPALFRTTDGGNTWTENLNWQEVVTDVLFESELEGWTMLRKGSLYYTTDGGLTWKLQSNIGSAERLTKTGRGFFATGPGGTIQFSQDGHGNWAQQNEGIGNRLTQIIFTDASHGIILGDSILFRTSNGGKKWSYESTGFSSVYPADFGTENRGLIRQGGSIFYTTDGGKSWNQPDNLPYLMHVFDIAYADNNRAFISAINYGHFFVNAYYYRSDNGGQKFDEIKPFEGRLIYDLFFTRSGAGFAIGDNGAFYTSNNKGETWTKGFIAERFQGNRIFFTDRSNGMVCGYYTHPSGRENQQIYRTNNGGDTWEKVFEDTLWGAPRIQSIFMTDKENAYAIAGGTILETHNGGESWSVGVRAVSLTAINGNSQVFAVGIYGTFLTTSPEAKISNETDWIPDDTLRLKPWPNPFNRELTVDFNLELSTSVDLTLWDYNGRMVLLKKVSGHPGKNEITLDGSSLPPGVYLLTLVGDSLKIVSKVVKAEVDYLR
jgi:photosystem II stability/assembly factor-like uncharacterized protein